jgi:hypothetical protein
MAMNAKLVCGTVGHFCKIDFKSIAFDPKCPIVAHANKSLSIPKWLTIYPFGVPQEDRHKYDK